MSYIFDIKGLNSDLLLRAFCYEQSMTFLISEMEKFLISDDVSLTGGSIEMKRRDNSILIVFDEDYPWCMITKEEVCQAFVKLCDGYGSDAHLVSMNGRPVFI